MAARANARMTKAASYEELQRASLNYTVNGPRSPNDEIVAVQDLEDAPR